MISIFVHTSNIYYNKADTCSWNISNVPERQTVCSYQRVTSYPYGCFTEHDDSSANRISYDIDHRLFTVFLFIYRVKKPFTAFIVFSILHMPFKLLKYEERMTTRPSELTKKSYVDADFIWRKDGEIPPSHSTFSTWKTARLFLLGRVIIPSFSNSWISLLNTPL